MVTKARKLTVAEYITQQIALSEKSQKQIADEVGYDKPNVVTMIKQGKTKLPINKVGPFARSLNVDPAYLLRLVMSEYMPDTWSAIESLIGESLIAKEEIALLNVIRSVTNGQMIDLTNPKATAQLQVSLKDIANLQQKDMESAVRATTKERRRSVPV